MSHPATGDAARLLDELLQLRCRAGERKRFFDDNGFAHREFPKSLDRLVHLALLGVNMDADEIQLGGNLFRDEPGEMAPARNPRQQPDGDQVDFVVFANRSRQPLDPGAGDLLPWPAAHVERDPLDEIETANRLTRIPVAGLLVAATGEGLIHEVVAENGRAPGAAFRNRAPEMGLSRPAVLLG